MEFLKVIKIIIIVKVDFSYSNFEKFYAKSFLKIFFFQRKNFFFSLQMITLKIKLDFYQL
jgi:hypothetical protein